MKTLLRQFPLLGPTSLPISLSLRSGQAFLLLLAIFACPTAVAASETADVPGSDLVWRHHCITCHGLNGVANSDRYPNLKGQNVIYLESRLKYFRAKEEPGNPMNAQASGLTDDEISKLAAYFSGGGI